MDCFHQEFDCHENTFTTPTGESVCTKTQYLLTFFYSDKGQKSLSITSKENRTITTLKIRIIEKTLIEISRIKLKTNLKKQ